MAAEKRKLLVEIDKCFKKIDEGLDIFDEIMNKLHDTSSENMRDKCQEDLKKEIKKLQRLRDQVKGWQSSSEIKEKDKLSLYRKSVESRMELFKDIERENKTKPHSKIGLSIEDKIDPKEKEKADLLDWLNTKIRSIQDEIDRTESKLEVMNTECPIDKKRRNRADTKQVELERTSLNSHLERVKFHLTNLEVCMRLVTNEKLASEDVKEKLMEPLDMYVDALEPDNDEDPEQLEPDYIYEELGLHEYIDQFGLMMASLDEEKVTSAKTSPEPVKAKPRETERERKPSQNKHSGSSNTVSSLPSTPKPASKNVSMPSQSNGSTQSLGSAAPSPTAMSYSTVVQVNQHNSFHHSTGASPATPISKKTASTESPTESKPELPKSTIKVATALSSSLPNKERQFPIARPMATCTTSPSLESSPTIVVEQKPMTEVTSKSTMSLPETKLSRSPVEDMSRPKSPKFKGPTQSATIDPLLAFGLTPGSRLLDEQEKAALDAINEASFQIPVPVDYLRARTCVPYMETDLCSSNWPTQPLAAGMTLEYYTKLHPETLFFIFYYMEGSHAQLLAATALKLQSWRFHKKFVMWFQRERDPDVINSEYELGTYVFFDYEHWMFRRREMFTFEYKYLESRRTDWLN